VVHHPTVKLPDANQILKQLSSSDWHVRRDAQARLVQLGEDAKPFIQQLIESADNNEARANAQSALAQIEQNRLLGTSYITLHVKDAPAAEVMEEISRQCFAPIQSMPENLLKQHSLPKITLDVDHKPFWDVMPPLCNKLGLNFRPYQSGMRLMQGGGVQNDGISQVHGPFLVVANQISYSRTRSFAGHGDQTQCGINFSIFPEPKLNVLHGGGAITVEEAIDDHGNSLTPTGNERMRFFGGFAGYGGWIYAPLEYPKKNPGSRLVRFKGSTTFIIQTESEKIEIKNLPDLHQTTRLVHGLQLTFQDFKKKGDTWQLRIHVNQPNFAGTEWPQLIEGVQTRLQVLDAGGRQLDHRGMNTSSNNNAADLTLDFAPSNGFDGRPTGQPTRLFWEVPTKTRDINLPIEFKDLPLFDDK
jgi:hypothetical protein